MKLSLLLISILLFTSCNKKDWQELVLVLPEGFPEITYKRSDLGSGYVGSEQKRKLILSNQIEIDLPIQMSARSSVNVYSIGDSLLYFQEEPTGFTVNVESSEVQKIRLDSVSSKVLVGEIVSPNIEDLEFIQVTKIINNQ